MEFKNFLKSTEITEKVLYKKVGKKFMSWSMVGTGTYSCRGEFGGDIANLPDEIYIEPETMLKIIDLLNKDMSFNIEDNTITVEGKNVKLTYGLEKPVSNEIKTAKIVYGDPAFILTKDDIEKIIKTEAMVKADTAVINLDEFAEIVVKGMIPSNKALFKINKINKMKSKQSFPSLFFETLRKSNGLDFKAFMLEGQEEAPLNLRIEDSNTTINYYIAPKIEKE